MADLITNTEELRRVLNMVNSQTVDVSGLETESKSVIGAINEVNQKANDNSNLTIDKIASIDNWAGGVSELGFDTEDGIYWSDWFSLNLSSGDNYDGEVFHRMPIRAGENVSFSLNEGGYIVNINSQITKAAIEAVLTGNITSHTHNYTNNTGTVTSVGLTVPTGLTVSSSPITTSGTLAITLTDGYSIPTTEKQGNWDTAYNWGNHASVGYTKNTGTVTSIATGTGLSGGPITTTGTISLANATARTVADTGTHHLICRDSGAGAMGYDSSIFIGGALGEFNATSFKVDKKSTIQYNTIEGCLEFSFS